MHKMIINDNNGDDSLHLVNVYYELDYSPSFTF